MQGTVHPSRTATITAQVDGVVDTVVGAGEAVRSGATIAQLANAAIARDTEVGRTQLALIDMQIRRAAAPSRAPRSAASESLNASEKVFQLRRDRLEKMKALRATNDVTADDVQQAEAEYLVALRDYRNERRVSEGIAPPGRDIEILQLERRKIVADQKFAGHRQSLLTMRAPFGGILTRVHVAAGQAVYPRDPIAEIADVSTMQVRAPIAAQLVRHVRTGMPVQVKLASEHSRTISSTVAAVVPGAQGAGGQAELPTIVINIPNPESSIQPDTQATVTLVSFR